MKVCILSFGTRGDVQPYIALGVGLKAAGHEVTLATTSEFETQVREYGLNFGHLRGDFVKAAQAAEHPVPGEKRPNPFQLVEPQLLRRIGSLDVPPAD